MQSDNLLDFLKEPQRSFKCAFARTAVAEKIAMQTKNAMITEIRKSYLQNSTLDPSLVSSRRSPLDNPVAPVVALSESPKVALRFLYET